MSYPGAIPPPPGVIADPDNPVDALRTVNYVTQGLTLFFATLFIVLRVYTRKNVLKGRWTSDDYSAVIAYASKLTRLLASEYGGGLNQWDVRKENIESFFKVSLWPPNVELPAFADKTKKCGYAATIFYAPMTMFVKIALLVLIARVFGSVHKKALFGIYSLLGLIVLYYASGLIVKIRICQPVSAYWRGETDKCLNQSAIITTDAIVSVISDLAILCLPLPLTWSLQLPFKKKLRVIGILCAGGMATAFSIYRLGLIVHDGHSPNQTIVFTKVVLTGNAEIGIGLICACLPSVTALIIKRNGSNNSSDYPRSGGTLKKGIFVNRTFHMSAESAQNRRGGDDGFERIQDETELMTYAQANPQAKESNRSSLSM
ncbi:hypothetical protein DL766_008045 [Monosporascus sp. MC13-8B]|uniref:Rhodopsin domain-containing protein n=1 Tax=Monosporascus cannonballus TaxID=155416 RepID=A0ABY0GZ01_9PEZI|nr:hypothetical protein DL762_007496 [Monosporascus cannonballus]RYO82741.1 hypothetical protein DL763_008130 [Monosporascus cannonballus]RYP20992.1 hypothetical protein DL766_008045 [Monosporascus sp. MC13-8B]